ncbi:hypothetical protein [Emticicia sp.]|uniref:hypothetical protein n=1 Tax=Emticicia sp. TaxID=1930953 RepID=UPI00375249D0
MKQNKKALITQGFFYVLPTTNLSSEISKMKDPIELNNDLVKYVNESAEKTEKIVGAKIARNTKISNGSRPNIKVAVNIIADGIIELQYIYRDSLRLRDMGAGRGYTKGQAIGSRNIRGRRPVRITNRPIFAQINRMSEIVNGVFYDFMVQETIPENLLKVNNNG